MAILGLLTDAASAVDYTILGSSMTVRDPLPGVNPSRRKIKFAATETTNVPLDLGDPIRGSAMVQVIVNGATSTAQIFPLGNKYISDSAGPGWLIRVWPGVQDSVKYVDKMGVVGPVTFFEVRWRDQKYYKVKAVIDGSKGPIDVVPGNPTSDLGVRYTLGSPDYYYCVLFGAAAGGHIADLGHGSGVSAAHPTGRAGGAVVVGAWCSRLCSNRLQPRRTIRVPRGHCPLIRCGIVAARGIP